MACNCTGALEDCIKAYVGPCDEGIDIGLTAPVSGNYLIVIEGINNVVRYSVELNEGDDIVLLNNINNNYVYGLQIFEPSGALLNDTCYTLRTIVTLDSSSSPTPSPVIQTMDCSITVVIVDSPNPDTLYALCNGENVRYEYASGNTLQILDEDGNPFLPGLYIQQPVFLANGVVQDMPYNSDLGTFDNSANGGFNPSGDANYPTKFTINYAQPI